MRGPNADWEGALETTTGLSRVARAGARGARLGCILAIAACCPHQTSWPVPVPYETDGMGQNPGAHHAGGRDPAHVWRLEVPLPLSPVCGTIGLEQFLHDESQCPALQTLDAFMRARNAGTTSIDKNLPTIDAEMWALLHSLADAQALADTKFPDLASLPGPIRSADRQQTVDSRDEAPPQGRLPVAFRYRNFWWTFWRKTRADDGPPPPDSPEAHSRETFNLLIVFPEYQGRIE